MIRNLILFLFMLALSAQGSLKDGLVAYWNLDQADGEVKVDSFSTNHLYDYSGTIDASNGKIRMASYFMTNESEGLVLTNGNFTFTGQQSFSVAGWFNIQRTTDWQQVISRSGYNREWQVQVRSAATNLQFFVMTNSVDPEAGNGILVDGKYVITSNEWHSFAAVCDAEGDKLYLYCDGKTTQSANFAFDSYCVDTGVLTVGQQYNSSTRRFDGSIDELGVWNRALTAAEIEVLRNNGIAMTYPFRRRNVFGQNGE